jgi:hypothetical protein
MKWQPIETAPRDGTIVLLFARRLKYPVMFRICGWWSRDKECWVELCFYEPDGLVAYNWMPLPEPPDAA